MYIAKPTQMNANFSTLVLLALKDMRHERGVHQGHLAQHAGKTPSAWTKIENGQSPLSTNAFFGACSAMQVLPSHVLTLVERLVPVFNGAGCFFHTMDLGEKEDDLLEPMTKYFSTSGYEALKARPAERMSLEAYGNPFFAPFMLPTAVRYCCETEFRKWMDRGAAAREQVLGTGLI